jgi:hypothetical protein
MSLIPMTTRESIDDEAKAEYDYWEQRSGRVTNMKRTMLHDLPVYRAYMSWYPLYERMEEMVGRRALDLFCYAISTHNHCLVCSTFFRQILVDSGDVGELGDAGDAAELGELGQLLMDFGHAIAQNPNQVPEAIYQRLKDCFSAQQLVLLFGFAGQMVATNYFNMIAKVDLDEVLEPYATPEFLAQVFAEGAAANPGSTG